MIAELRDVAITIHSITADALPRFSGVYRFFGEGDELLYIGKSIDIRSRISAHYQEARHPGRHQRIMQQVRRIDCTATAGELGALLIENAAIKSESPLYNRRQRQVRRLWTLQLRAAATGFLQPHATDFLPEAERSHDCYGLYHNKRHIETTLRRHARDNGLCLQILGLEKGRGPCFQYQLRRCDGACAGEESVEAHNARLLGILDSERIAAWPYPGPILLQEHNVCPLTDQPAQQFHLINHWCYQGSYLSQDDARQYVDDQRRRLFDRDAYRLVLKALHGGSFALHDAQSGKPLTNPLKRQRASTQ